MATEAVVLVWREAASRECTPEVLEGLGVCIALRAALSWPTPKWILPGAGAGYH